MASAVSSSLTDAGCVQSICTDPIRRIRRHISFRFASSRCDSRSYISTNGLRVEPGRARLRAARSKRCAASTVPVVTSTTMRAPNWRAIARSTICCKLCVPSAELRPVKKKRIVKTRSTPIKKTRRDRQLFIWNNTKALFEHLTKFFGLLSQSRTGRVAHSKRNTRKWARQFARQCLVNWPTEVKLSPLLWVDARETPSIPSDQVGSELLQMDAFVGDTFVPSLFVFHNQASNLTISRRHNHID